MASKKLSLDASPETRSLIFQGNVVHQLLQLLKTAKTNGRAVVNDPSLTLSWPTTPGCLADNTMVFANGTTITRLPLPGSRINAFRIEGRSMSGNGSEAQSLIIHAAEGQAWVPPQS